MPDIAHQALERHIDLQHPDLAEALNSLADLHQFLEETSHNYIKEPDASISTFTAKRALIINDILRELQLFGDSYTIVAPRQSTGASAAASIPFSIFSNGAKTLIFYRLCAITNVAAAVNLQVNLTTTDPNYANLFIPAHNRRLDKPGTNTINATFSTTAVAPPVDSSLFDLAGVSVNDTHDIIDKDEIIVIPAGVKLGFTIWCGPVGATAASVGIKASFIELPF